MESYMEEEYTDQNPTESSEEELTLKFQEVNIQILLISETEVKGKGLNIFSGRQALFILYQRKKICEKVGGRGTSST